MKTKFLFTAALAAMAFTSCQKDGADQGTVQSGQDTYIGMTIQLPKSAGTRAVDVTATTEESKLTSVTVGTWSPTEGVVTYTDLDISDLTFKDGLYTAKAAVKAKTGACNVIVLANTTAKPTIEQINGDAFEATVAGIATKDNFVMYSDEIEKLTGVVFASKEEVEAGLISNKATVTLRRAAAKVAVTSSLAATDDTGVADVLNNGLLTDIKWNIVNQNTQMTVFPRFVSGTDFIASNVNSPFVRLANSEPTTTLPANGADAAIAYCLENAHGAGIYKENNTTAVQVSAIFAPGATKYVSEITGTGAADAVIVRGAAAMTAGTTFYVSKEDIGTAFGKIIFAGTFLTAEAVEDAKTIFSATDANFEKYEAGKCFWSIWIHDGATPKSYGVLRNHMYTMNITGIKSPGFSKFPDTEDPIITDTWIMVELGVEQWYAKGMGDIEL